MSIRKVSDLPSLYVDSSDYNEEKFKHSLVEISYDTTGAESTVTRYTSRYIEIAEAANILCTIIIQPVIVDV